MRIAWSPLAATRLTALAALALVAAPGAGCGSKGSRPDGGTPPPPPGAPPAATSDAAAAGCSDLFRQDMVRTYSIDIAPAEWDSVRAEFYDVASLKSRGNDFVVRHPIVFRMGSETVSDATLKLHGQSSWAYAAQLDGDRAKMQFDVSFHQRDPAGKFHDVEKLVFDMPRSDWTFLHDRIAHAWLRQIGIAAGCVASARVEINGSYYGLFAVEETTNKRVLRQFFPDNAGGDLWKGGVQPETNQAAPNWDRQKAFAQAAGIAGVSAIVDLSSSVFEWAAEALINNADGSYGGTHNFYIYDQGPAGFVYLPNDTDSTFDWLSLFDVTPYNDHPIYWWSTRAQPAPAPGGIWLAAMGDPTRRRQYVDAIAVQLASWDVAQIQGWIDAWSQQIAADVEADPHTWATPEQFRAAVAAARDIVARRPQFLQSFVDCERGAPADDQDGDGFRWCEDCRDDNPSMHPGAPEVCGNGIDDNCDGTVDEGCH